MSNRIPLPAGTTLGKSFEHGIEVNLGTRQAPDWQSIRRITGFAPTYPATTTDQATYDDGGAPNEAVSGRGFAAAFQVQGNRNQNTGLYLRELEAILAAGKRKGDAATLDVRWYHKPFTGEPNPTDAGRATVRVEVTRQNTGNAENEVYSVSFTGQGEFEEIANPFTGWDPTTAPVIRSVGPALRGTGELVTITGDGFLDATAVSIGGEPAEDFTVVAASTIVAVLPADTAGAAPVIVTGPAGASAAFDYTRDV